MKSADACEWASIERYPVGDTDILLLKRDSGSNDDFSTVTVVDSYVDGQQLTFTASVSKLGSEFTLGADAGSPTAVSLYHLQIQSSSGTGIITVMLLALSLLLLTLVTVGRRRTA